MATQAPPREAGGYSRPSEPQRPAPKRDWDPYEKVNYSGVTLDRYTFSRYRRAMQMAGLSDVPLYQGSYHPGHGPSAGTHDGGGVIDVNTSAMSSTQKDRFLRALERAGFVAFLRAEGSQWPEHIHAVARGNRYLSPESRAQIGQGGGSTGGGGGGGSYPTPRGASQAAAAQLSMAGYSFPFDVSNYIDKAIDLGLSGSDASAYAYSLIIKSPEFKDHYPGIFRPDGRLRVSPVEYEQYAQRYQNIAAQSGFSLSRKMIGRQIAHGRTPEEFQIVARAVQNLKTNPQLRLQLAAIHPKLNTMGEQVKFMLGRSDKTVYDTYETAQISAVAKSAGVDMTLKRAGRLASQTEGILSMEQTEERFKAIADAGRLASVELAAEGISNRHLEILEFDGPNRIRIANKVERILRTREAQRAVDPLAPQTTVSDDGRLTQGFSRRPVGL